MIESDQFDLWPEDAEPADGQAENLERVSSRIGRSIVDFCRAHRRFHADELRQYCQGQIAHFKVPQHVMIVESMPKTVTGKIRKQVLREQAIQQFELADAARIETA